MLKIELLLSVGMISKLKHNVPPEKFMKLYYIIIYPQLYGILV